MKKLLASLFALAMMAGCSGNAEPKTLTCTGSTADGDINTVISAEGDDVTKEEITMVSDLTDLGIDASTLSDDEKKTVIDTMVEATGMSDIKGVTYKAEFKDNTIVSTASIDYTVADIKELQDADLVDSGLGTSISLEKTKENYEKEGLTCK